MRGDGSFRHASEIAVLAPEGCSGPETCSESDGLEPAEAGDRILGRDERSEALRFWRDISGMWPRSWWNAKRLWQDLQLRRYARRKIRELEGESRAVKSRVARRHDTCAR